MKGIRKTLRHYRLLGLLAMLALIGTACASSPALDQSSEAPSGAVFVRKWGAPGASNGRMGHPSGVAVDQEGRVYVVDTGNSRIQVFDSSGEFLAILAVPGIRDGRVLLPQGIAIDELGNIYIVDSGNQRIQVLSPEGAFVAKWGSTGSKDSQVNVPQGIALDRQGNIYLADTDNDRIQVFRRVSP